MQENRTVKLLAITIYNELKPEELLEKDRSFTIHHYNIKMLCNELYKVYQNLAQAIFSDS